MGRMSRVTIWAMIGSGCLITAALFAPFLAWLCAPVLVGFWSAYVIGSAKPSARIVLLSTSVISVLSICLLTPFLIELTSQVHYRVHLASDAVGWRLARWLSWPLFWLYTGIATALAAAGGIAACAACGVSRP